MKLSLIWENRDVAVLHHTCTLAFAVNAYLWLRYVLSADAYIDILYNTVYTHTFFLKYMCMYIYAPFKALAETMLERLECDETRTIPVISITGGVLWGITHQIVWRGYNWV